MNDEDRCPATNRNGERCGHPQAWGVEDKTEGPCKFHGGSSTGGDGGAREGAGAPEDNVNGTDHGAYTDQHNLYNKKFTEREVDLADRIYNDYIERYTETHGSEPPAGFEVRLFKVSVNAVTEMRVDNWYTDKPDELDTGTPHIDKEPHVSESGQRYYRYKKSPAIPAIDHLSSYNHRWLKNLNLLPDAESKRAEAEQSMIGILSSEANHGSS